MQRQTILSIGIHLENPASAPSNLCPQLPYRSRIEMIPKLIQIQKQLTVHVVLQRKRRSVSESPHFQFTPKERHPVFGMPSTKVYSVRLRMLTGQIKPPKTNTNNHHSGYDPCQCHALSSIRFVIHKDIPKAKAAITSPSKLPWKTPTAKAATLTFSSQSARRFVIAVLHFYINHFPYPRPEQGPSRFRNGLPSLRHRMNLPVPLRSTASQWRSL